MSYPFRWYLKDGYKNKNKYNVFGTFVCGGGSTMGYKLAGFNHLGGVEIDKEVAKAYVKNHKPKHFYLEDIRKFNQRNDIPEELYSLDILDGSPPCSSFSMTGNRDKDWGKKKVFREGQQEQQLDDLVFEYIKTINKLQPKVALLENVKGLIQGNAKAYTKKIIKGFSEAGYRVQLFLLNSATMGVPQKRERVFFIGLRNDIDAPKLKLKFNESVIPFGAVDKKTDSEDEYKPLTELYEKYWKTTPIDGVVGKFKAGSKKLNPKRVSYTIIAGGGTTHCHHKECRMLSKQEICMIGTYPLDYDFCGIKWFYLVGMSVPPVMIANIADEIKKQWLDKVDETLYVWDGLT